MAVRLADLIATMDAAYPPRLAEDWDTGIGLTCGDPDAAVSRVLLAVDADPLTVAEAAETGAQVLLTHHPLLFRPVQSVAADTPKGGLVHRLLAAGIAHFAAHTNADRAPLGVNDALARALDLRGPQPLEPAPGSPMDKLVVFVPRDHTDRLMDALAAAGAGRVGNYSHAGFTVDGTGQFRPLAGANPTIGRLDQLERVPETRIDMVLPRGRRSAVVAALFAAHPYEEPGFDLTEMAPLPSTSAGLGRIGDLPEPLNAAELAEMVARVLPATVTGVRLAGSPDRQVSRVAVCGGAGGSLMGRAAAAGADAFLTADLGHHVAAEFAATAGPVLLDVSHWASEWPWLPVLADLLRERLDDAVEVAVSTRRTDPWTVRAG